MPIKPRPTETASKGQSNRIGRIEGATSSGRSEGLRGRLLSMELAERGNHLRQTWPRRLLAISGEAKDV